MKRITIIIFLLGIFQIGYSAPTKPVVNAPTKPTVNAQTKPSAEVLNLPAERVAKPKYYGTGLCKVTGYTCIEVKKGDTWQKLWPDEKQRHIVQEVNRTNMYVSPGTTIAVPNNLANITLLDVAPFPKQIKPSDNKLIMVDQNKLAWGAYDRSGALVTWGSLSSGKNFCPDIKRSCITMTGEFYVFNKKDKKCKSSVFPVDEGGGAEMPYCMFFYRGYALHGSPEVPGYRASHGCVRLFTEDALWLNHNFVELPSAKNNYLGTRVIVQKLISTE